jgi:hypothetical protein
MLHLTMYVKNQKKSMNDNEQFNQFVFQLITYFYIYNKRQNFIFIQKTTFQ